MASKAKSRTLRRRQKAAQRRLRSLRPSRRQASKSREKLLYKGLAAVAGRKTIGRYIGSDFEKDGNMMVKQLLSNQRYGLTKDSKIKFEFQYMKNDGMPQLQRRDIGEK
jgi:hypothetical protein